VRIATWNVNSIRSRIDRVEAFVERQDIDVLALQETKARDDQWPVMGLEAMGYEVATLGHSQWNGVAIASRVGLTEVQHGFEGMPAYGDPLAAEARAIGATCGGVRVWSLYVPNGRALGDPHYDYKLHWLAALAEYTRTSLETRPDLPLALVGDFNIAPTDADNGDPAVVVGFSTHVSPLEREAFATLEASGLSDAVRPLVPTGFTYWDYKRLRFPRNEGMRIDFILGSRALTAAVTGAAIHRDERKGEAPSDHVPVVVDLDFAADEDDDDRPMIW